MKNPTIKKTREIQTFLGAWLSTNQAKINNIVANNKAMRAKNQAITKPKDGVSRLRL